jgi:hypothetical protein
MPKNLLTFLTQPFFRKGIVPWTLILPLCTSHVTFQHKTRNDKLKCFSR